jgi:hypothetical protein
VSAFYELDSPDTMRTDAAAAGARLPLVAPRLAFTDVYAEYPTDLPKPEVEITEAAQRIANALHLHLD